VDVASQLGQHRGIGEPTQRSGQRRCDELRGADAIQDESPRRRELNGLGEQGIEIVDRDAAIAELLGEGVVFLAGLRGPQHVVEQQLVAVAGSQPAQFQSGPVDKGLSQRRSGAVRGTIIPGRPELGVPAAQH
jgi:hypothetical protein